MNASTTLLCLGTGLIVSCGNVDQPDELRAERDSAGIRIVDVREPIPEWSVSPDTVLRIGVVDGDPAYQFHRVVYAARLSDGGMVVVDGGTVDVRWFRPTGVHMVTYGRRGEGPGEFRAVAEASLSGDTIVVHDSRNQRLMWLSPDGSLTSERTHEGGRQTRLIGASGRNVLAAATHQQFEYSKEYSRLPSIVALIQARPGSSDTIAQVEGPDAALWVRFVDGRPVATVSMELPFSRSLLLSSTRGGLLYAQGDQSQLIFLGAAGNVRRIVRLEDHVPRSVTDEDRRQYVVHAIQQAEGAGRPGAQAAESARQRLALLNDGHRVPLFDRLLTGSDGFVWIRKYHPAWARDQPQEWFILRPDGHAAGRITLSPGFNLMHAGDGYITGVSTDEFDVEYVVSLRIEQYSRR